MLPDPLLIGTFPSEAADLIIFAGLKDVTWGRFPALGTAGDISEPNLDLTGIYRVKVQKTSILGWPHWPMTRE